MTGDTIDLERRYTIADLDGLPEDGRRYELAGGRLLVSPMARRRHQVGCDRLGDVLKSACPPHLFVFPLPINVDDPDATHFEPDLTVVRHEFALVENGDVPLLAVEVRSPSTAGRDAVRKRREYARLGITSYWLLDVDLPSLRVLELVGDDYIKIAYAAGGPRGGAAGLARPARARRATRGGDLRSTGRGVGRHRRVVHAVPPARDAGCPPQRPARAVCAMWEAVPPRTARGPASAGGVAARGLTQRRWLAGSHPGRPLHPRPLPRPCGSVGRQALVDLRGPGQHATLHVHAVGQPRRLERRERLR
ncbi:MAG: Uma2 family endonuclease [Actinobacteria bacterium]|nr:Uma2 family endonuclease [Actinomycetota bacterium]MBW3647569.1 Uma2 family endonuclease [Actinomycetota bacterium]